VKLGICFVIIGCVIFPTGVFGLDAPDVNYWQSCMSGQLTSGRLSENSLEAIRKLTGMKIRFLIDGQTQYTTGIFRYIEQGRQGFSRKNDQAHIGKLLIIEPSDENIGYTNMSNGLTKVLVKNIQHGSIQVFRNGIWSNQ
jgi:hypothetical protein